MLGPSTVNNHDKRLVYVSNDTLKRGGKKVMRLPI